MWWLNETVKPAVPGLNPASIQPAGTCHSLLGASRVGMMTAGWPLRGDRGKKIHKYKKNNKKKRKYFSHIAKHEIIKMGEIKNLIILRDMP